MSMCIVLNSFRVWLPVLAFLYERYYILDAVSRASDSELHSLCWYTTSLSFYSKANTGKGKDIVKQGGGDQFNVGRRRLWLTDITIEVINIQDTPFRCM